MYWNTIHASKKPLDHPSQSCPVQQQQPSPARSTVVSTHTPPLPQAYSPPTTLPSSLLLQPPSLPSPPRGGSDYAGRTPARRGHKALASRAPTSTCRFHPSKFNAAPTSTTRHPHPPPPPPPPPPRGPPSVVSHQLRSTCAPSNPRIADRGG
jgi:hypothetical protein